MTAQKDKVKTLIGFAVKAKKLILGLDNITKTAKNPYLVLASADLTDKTLKEIKFVCAKKKCKIILFNEPLETITHINGCKIAGITDKQMSDAILQAAKDNYTIVTPEVKIDDGK